MMFSYKLRMHDTDKISNNKFEKACVNYLYKTLTWNDVFIIIKILQLEITIESKKRFNFRMPLQI